MHSASFGHRLDVLISDGSLVHTGCTSPRIASDLSGFAESGMIKRLLPVDE